MGKRIPENLYRKIHKVLPLICTDVVVVGGQRKKFFLLVKRKNKPEKGKWWFPGGRIYKNELLKDAAVRKVREETGWLCRIPPRRSGPLLKVRYFFMRGKIKIRKRVIWFLMEPVQKSGSRDPDEILRVRWIQESKFQ